jgi:hypothetical protein
VDKWARYLQAKTVPSAQKTHLPSADDDDEHFDNIASLIELYRSDGDGNDEAKLLARRGLQRESATRAESEKAYLTTDHNGNNNGGGA